MQRSIITTEDGSSSVFVESLKQSYHSTHGAMAESQHIFIKDGLEYFHPKKSVNILEIGFGTGLNALLTLKFVRQNNFVVNYFAVEKYPLNLEEVQKLNYASLLEEVNQEDFMKIHSCPWEEEIVLYDNFSLHKSLIDIRLMHLKENWFEVVFFDAFSPDKQPELWSESVFRLIYESMKKGGVLTTYSVKGDVKRALKSVGFAIEKIPGPKGKREILRAQK